MGIWREKTERKWRAFSSHSLQSCQVSTGTLSAGKPRVCVHFFTTLLGIPSCRMRISEKEIFSKRMMTN
jgi:hypothetical protein